MKIVILAGDPHKKEISNTLALEFVIGAKESGKEVEIIDLTHTDIHPCMGCDACGMNGDCEKDKENEILNKILKSDAIVFASFVYYNVSSWLKMMIDRFYAKTTKITNKNLKASFIMIAWNNDEDWTYGAIDKYFDILFEYMHFKDPGRIYGKGCRTISMMPKKYYEDAYKLGMEI